SRVLAKFTTDSACLEILQTIRRVAKLPPRVSVIVPNYNCEPYLERRLKSIIAQSFKDMEILLLDDKSTDGSRIILCEFAASHSQASLFLSEHNGGSAFNAWERGL